MNKKIRAEIQALQTRTDNLERENKELQGFIIDDIDRATAATTKYTGNSYKTYDTIIAAIAKKYQAQDNWGNQPTGNIVDVRSAFIIGEGISVSPADPADTDSEEMKFVKAFFEYNQLDREMPQEFAKEGEIEGCFLGTLKWIEEDLQVSIRFMSRVETKYTVIHPKDDYSWYQKVEWKDGGEAKELKEDDFIYARFGGRIHKPNEPTPKIGKCLTEIDSLSMALRDWREIDNLFAAPIPHVTCETPEQAKYMAENIEKVAKNWKLKKLFAHTGTLGYATPAELKSLENEIITLAKIISGATGVPVHFLGLPDLMSNRSTADNLMELVSASTSKERLIWQGTYQQIIAKAMKLWNANSKLTPLDPSKVKVTIPYISEATWTRITSVYMPMYLGGGLSLETMLTKTPGINVSEEMERIKKEKDENMARMEKTAPANDDEDDEDEEDDKAAKGKNKNLEKFK